MMVQNKARSNQWKAHEYFPHAKRTQPSSLFVDVMLFPSRDPLWNVNSIISIVSCFQSYQLRFSDFVVSSRVQMKHLSSGGVNSNTGSFVLK